MPAPARAAPFLALAAPSRILFGRRGLTTIFMFVRLCVRGCLDLGCHPSTAGSLAALIATYALLQARDAAVSMRM